MELVRIKNLEELEVVRPLLLNPAHHSYRTAFRVEAEVLADYEYENLQSVLEMGQIAMVFEHGQPVGVAALKEHPWESEQYGFSMGKVTTFIVAADVAQPRLVCSKLLSWMTKTAAPELSLKHLLCRATAEDIALVHCLEASSFRHMTTMMQMFWPKKPKSIPTIPEGWSVRYVEEKDWLLLVKISGETLSKIITRFSADPHLPEVRTQALYEAWAAASLDGRFADVNFVIEREGEKVEAGFIDGFISARFHEGLGKLLGCRFGEYTIGSVHPESRGSGAFHAGVRGIARWFWEHDTEAVVAYTQAHNYGSLRTLISAGARPVESHHCFHYWLGA
jgi:hypothetical protein